MTVQFLGTSTSLGVPMIGCNCPTCCSDDPHDRRMRCALIIESGDTRLLIDCGPDIHSQLLRAQISEIDALLVTHSHSDHLFGLDDLRPLRFARGKQWRLPVFAHPETLGTLKLMFPWVLEASEHRDGYLKIDANPVTHGQTRQVGSVSITPIEVYHGGVATVGWLIEADGQRLAYFSDIKSLKPGAELLLAELDLLVLDCLRDQIHPTHLNTGESLALTAQLAAKRTLFTHFSHDLRHAELAARLPPSVQPAFDGLCLELGHR